MALFINRYINTLLGSGGGGWGVGGSIANMLEQRAGTGLNCLKWGVHFCASNLLQRTLDYKPKTLRIGKKFTLL